MNKRLTIVLVMVLLLPPIACVDPAAEWADEPISGLEAGSDEASLVEGNGGFAFDLYQALKGQEGNLFYSPYSISLTLAMTYAGARGETAQQMADTLHFLLEQDKLHPTFEWLAAELAIRGEEAACITQKLAL